MQFFYQQRTEKLTHKKGGKENVQFHTQGFCMSDSSTATVGGHRGFLESKLSWLNMDIA